MKRFSLIAALVCLSFVPAAQAQRPKGPLGSVTDKAKKPVPYLSIGEVYARRDPLVTPPRIRVVGNYHNYNFATITGATFSLERWDGRVWKTIKSGTLNPVAANKPGAESADLPLSNAAMKFRFVLSKSVEGSKEFTLSGIKSPVKKFTPKPGGPSKKPPVLGDQVADGGRGPSMKLPEMGGQVTDVGKGPLDSLYRPNGLSIDQFYAKRFHGGIFIGALMTNKNLGPAASTTYSIYRWTGNGLSPPGKGWTKIKSGTLKATKPSESVFESMTLPASNDGMKFKIEVALSVQGQAECTLVKLNTPPPAKVFVVQYRAVDWQILPGWSGRTPLESAQRRKGLNKLGFDTKYSYVTNDYIFTSSTHLTVYYRSVTWRERTFGTLAAAQEFQNSRHVNATQPNREYADILPNPGVEVKIIER